MALRVPTVNGPSVATGAAPSAFQRSSATPDLLGGAGRQLQAFGEAALNTGTQLQAIQNDALLQANALRVDDALNQAQEAALRLQFHPEEGFTAQKGYDAVARSSGWPLADEYASKLQQEIVRISGTLSNPAQRQAFGAKAGDIVTNFRGRALEYEGRQYRDYNLSVRDASTRNAQNQLVLNMTDPEQVSAQAARIRASIEGGQDESGVFVTGSAQMQGKSAAWAKEAADEAVSQAHTTALKSAMDMGNVNLAMAYFRRYSPQMTPKDIAAVGAVLQRDYDTRQGMTIADQVFKAVRPQIAPDDFTRLTTLVTQQESGGRRYGTDGALLTSPKGAQGEMQVMPATAKDPGYGVRPAQDDSPDELARVGRDYLGAMLRRYQGDVSKALAAYNAGPGVVDDAVGKAGQGLRTGTDWRAYLPSETQAYVRAVATQFTQGAGAPPKPTLADLHDQVARTLGPNASPLAVKAATERLTQLYSDQEKAQQQREAEIVATASREIVQNGGNFNAMAPDTRSKLMFYAPGRIDELMAFAGKVTRGQDTTNPAVYLRLSDPRVLGSMSEQQLYALRTELSQDDLKHFANERAKLVGGLTSTGPGDLNSPAIRNTLDQRLRELKMDPTPKDGTDDAARVGAIRRFVDTEILAMQRNAGKKFNDAETSAAIDRLAATNVTLQGMFRSYSAPLLAVKPGDIPSPVRKKIEAAFAKQGVTDPTDAQVLDALMHYSVRQHAGAAAQ
jgi:soluble lytic murein transglycosylase